MKKYLAALLLTGAMVSYSPKEKIPEDPGYWWGHKELLKMGVPEWTVKTMHGDLAMRIAMNFNDKHIPRKWIDELCLAPWIYTCEKIKKDEYYLKDNDRLAESIQKRIAKERHIFRDDMGYTENMDSLSQIKDKNLLVIIKKYYDFFDNPKTGKEIKNMFPEGEDSDEYIGIIRQKRKNFELFIIDTRWEEKFYPPRFNESPKNNVPPLSVIPYINHVGVIHSHTLGKMDKQNGIAGPSSADISIMKNDNRINPYQVNAVVTYINDKEYNADIYFSEIYKEGGYPYNTPYYFVYDLGVFKFGK